MKAKAIIPLALGLCIGLVAVKVVVDTVKQAKGSQSDQKISVVQAKVDLDPFTEITKEMVQIVEMPQSAPIPATDRVENLEAVVGRVTAKSVPMSAFVLQSMLAAPGTPAGMVGRIPEGFRAVSVKIDEVTGVAYQIKPGDWVDVIVVMDINRQRRQKETIAEVILQNIQVAAIGQDAVAATGNSSVKAKPAKSATLFVKHEDVPKLHLAATRGKITLAMRGDDTATTLTTNVTRDVDAFEYLRKEKEAEDEQKRLQEEAAAAQAAAAAAARMLSNSNEPVAELDPEVPHAVVIRRGSTEQGTQEDVQVITFENSESSTIVDVSPGPATGAGRMGRSSGNSGRNANRARRNPPQPREHVVPENERNVDFAGE